jgi:hypothetical protein
LTFLIASCPLMVGMLKMDRKPNKSAKSPIIYDEMIKRLKAYGVELDHLCDAKTWESLEGSCIAGKQWTPPSNRRAKSVSDEPTKPATAS